VATTLGSSACPDAATPEAPLLEVVVPVHNEAHVLAASADRLVAYLADEFPFSWRITIVDNASTDRTWIEATKLAALHDGVSALRLDAKGRGRALRAAWSASEAPVVAYMDVDLSTDLRALLPLVAPLVSGHSDLAVGSRLATGARVVRRAHRELISRVYNRLLRLVFRNGFRDAQCGFKAVRADVARRLLPRVVDDGWFFDTELLLLAERNGFRISEIAVDWVDDPDSRVNLVRTAIADLKGMGRLALGFWTGRAPVEMEVEVEVIERRSLPAGAGSGGEIVGFASVGVVSTVAYFGLLLGLRHPLGLFAANAVALTITMLANTTTHRAWTFGRRGPGGRRREWARAAAVHLAGLAVTSAAIVAAKAVDGASTTSLAVLLLMASAASTALRFLLMPAWVFRKRPLEGTSTAQTA
jgi:putative flippase GtrA